MAGDTTVRKTDKISIVMETHLRWERKQLYTHTHTHTHTPPHFFYNIFGGERS